MQAIYKIFFVNVGEELIKSQIPSMISRVFCISGDSLNVEAANCHPPQSNGTNLHREKV